MGKPYTKAEEAAEWARVRSWVPQRETTGAPGDGPAAGLVRELQAVGVPLLELGELANVRIVYPKAIPILIEHAYRPYPDAVKWSIIRALTIPGAGEPLHSVLLDLVRSQYQVLSSVSLYSLGSAIAQTAPRGQIETLIEIVSNPKFSDARLEPLLRLARSKDPRVPMIAIEFFAEGSAPWYAIRALRLAKVWSLEMEVAAYADSENDVLRDESRKYRKAFEKRSKVT